nr:SDR family oxidoreductase [Rhodococcus sp. (in: high G+C Gram-positive bacteria)]
MDIVIVTGASAGIGRATAIELGARGMGVVVTYNHRASDAADVVRHIESEGGTAAALQLDVADIAALPGFVQRLIAVLEEKWETDRLYGLVNNAGIGGGAPFAEVTEEEFDRFHTTLFKGPYFLTQQLLPMISDGGVIVNTGSTSALPSGTEAGYSSYASQKGAVHTLTRCWAKECSPRRIRVNAVAPGSTRTQIADDAFTRMPDAVAAAASTVALGRIGEPEDVARAIAFLAGRDGGWITGEVIECSGGQNL